MKKQQKVVDLAIKHFGKLYILVNNAGCIINKLLIDTTLEDWDLILATNVTGAFLYSKEALKAMIPNKSGAIVSNFIKAKFEIIGVLQQPRGNNNDYSFNYQSFGSKNIFFFDTD